MSRLLSFAHLAILASAAAVDDPPVRRVGSHSSPHGVLERATVGVAAAVDVSAAGRTRSPQSSALPSAARARAPRLLCIFPARSGHAGIELQRRALSGGCDSFRFFVCGEHNSAAADENGFVVISMQGQEESHKNIWEKVWRMWSWVGEHEQLDDYDWVVKLDLDTLFSPWNLKRMLQTEASMKRADFIGHAVSHYGTDEAPVGAAYALRSQALRRAVPVLATLKPGADASLVQSSRYQNAQHCSPERTVAEEMKFAHCLGVVGINVAGAVDVDGREYIQPFQLCSHRFWMSPPKPEDTKNDWFWKGKPLNASLADCCATYPVAFHSYSLPELERIYPIFTGRSGRGSKDGSEVTMTELQGAHKC